MKKFSYSLQKLLNLREFREKEAEIALGKANAIRDGIQLSLDKIALQRVQSTMARRQGLALNELLAIEHFIVRLDSRKEELLEDLVRAELVVQQKRQKYIEVSRDRQVITKLREKKEASWHKEMLDDEANILDDIASSARHKINT